MNMFNHQELSDLAKELEVLINQRGEYSEILPIEADGSVSTEKRIGDDEIPFLSSIYRYGFTILDDKCKSRSPKKVEVEGFYALLKAIGEYVPDLKVVIQEDPKERKWVKYTVAKK